MVYKDLEKRRKYFRDYAKKHPDYDTKHYKICVAKKRKEIFQLLGNQCANPYGLHDKSFTDIRCLQIDHIHGNGTKDRKSKSAYTYYRAILIEIKASSKDYQLLCANCNTIKRVENKEN